MDDLPHTVMHHNIQRRFVLLMALLITRLVVYPSQHDEMLEERETKQGHKNIIVDNFIDELKEKYDLPKPIAKLFPAAEDL